MQGVGIFTDITVLSVYIFRLISKGQGGGSLSVGCVECVQFSTVALGGQPGMVRMCKDKTCGRFWTILNS